MAGVPASSRGDSSSSSGALTLLSTTTVAGSDATIDVSSISQAYNDLYMVLIARGASTAATTDTLLVRLNNDSGGNYSSDLLRSNNVTAGGVQSLSATSSQVSVSAATNNVGSLASAFSTYLVTIPGYASTTWLKQIMVQSSNSPVNGSATIVPELTSGVWLSTAAVTRVTFFGNNTAALKIGSTLRIYGRL